MNMNYEYIAAHISDYIKNENFFNTFDIEDIKKIMKYSNLTTIQYITLLKQSSKTISAKNSFICTRNANVTIQNKEEVVSILKSVKKYMKFKIMDGIINILDQKEKESHDSTEQIQKHQEKLKEIQNQIQNAAKETNVNQTNESSNHSREILTKIAELKKSYDIKSVYKLFEELSTKRNQEMIQKACEEGLWEKETACRKNVLHIACEKGNLELVKSLIECKCDKEAEDGFGYTPLITASSNNKLEVVKYLISVGADKEAVENRNSTPLICALRNGHIEIVKYLVSIGINKEAKDSERSTPLIWASKEGLLEIVKYLISIGANKEAKNKYRYTPLIYASEKDHLEIVKYLISVGADKEAMNKGRYTPLIYASKCGELEVVQYLISIGDDKEAKDENGYTPLISASKTGHLGVVKYLISIGADKEAKDDIGSTPLICASDNGHYEVVKYLISIGADKEAMNLFRKTALGVAKGDVKST
ncbi:ankyrin repeat protein, putative [Trichomonas vaginalis G3]|uniref:Ankyrin repeat protein, putative n=1 Tax=Trichomonas vaginalis (strain ATCC PRA-98 / G3) TaxID=412133 RepID=A2ECQ9_TRIV3|nr:ankyrin repeat protein family [Trichomonas vaginalis G3]EAY09555.1 ankyrin repeat protein, putative [Trichomonas vaginalis G3]KAI5533183.1 ankyrin repeat protein family [Trichomonas vaginalis G3]|eukprot:XP_001321778.1 ankyrin repeat protein [Trichomonas vaginalis G3]